MIDTLKIIELLNFNKKNPKNHSFCTTSLDGKFTNILILSGGKLVKLFSNECNHFKFLSLPILLGKLFRLLLFIFNQNNFNFANFNKRKMC